MKKPPMALHRKTPLLTLALVAAYLVLGADTRGAKPMNRRPTTICPTATKGMQLC